MNKFRCLILIFFVVGFLLTFDVACQDAQPTPSPSPTPLAVVECDISDDECKAVPQDFIDDAAKAFELVIAQREALQKFKNERAATDAERKAVDILIAGLDKVLAIYDKTLDAADKLRLMYKSFIETQNKFIDALLELVKAKQKTSFLGSLWNSFKDFFKIVLAFYAGRAVGT